MFTVRAMTPDDCDAVADIQVRAWRATYPGILPQEVLDNLDTHKASEQWRLGMQKSPDIARFAAVDEGQVRSYLVGGENRYETLIADVRGEIWAIYTDPEFHGRGYGKALLLAFWKCYPDGFCVSVAVGNEGARKFYERLGGQRAGTHDRQVGGKDIPHWLFSFLPLEET